MTRRLDQVSVALIQLQQKSRRPMPTIVGHQWMAKRSHRLNRVRHSAFEHVTLAVWLRMANDLLSSEVQPLGFLFDVKPRRGEPVLRFRNDALGDYA